MNRIKIFGSIVASQIVSDDMITAKKYDIETEIKNHIYLKSRIITVNEANGNGDFLPKDEVTKERDYDGTTLKAWETFKGKMVDYNHDTSMKLGEIIDANYCEGKDGENDSVEIICKIDKDGPHLDIVARILSGELDKMSMEAFADNAECSYCAAKFEFHKPCTHISSSMNAKIKAENGEEVYVYRIDRDLIFVGAGIVDNPADKKAGFKKVLANEEQPKKKEVKDITKLMESLNAMDLIRLTDALSDDDDATKFVADLNEKIVEPIYESELGQYIDKRMTAVEINKIKKQLYATGKLIDKTFNAHLVKLNGKQYWLVMKNGIPLFKASIKEIWRDVEDMNEKVEGDMTYAQYAISELFKKRLLIALQTQGEEYIMSIWHAENPAPKSKSILEVLNFKAEKVNASLITASKKDEMIACVKANLDNKEIKATGDVTQQNAVEAYCFNKVNGFKATLAEIYVTQAEANEDVVGGKLNFKTWLKYKETGKWPNLLSDQIRIKCFANTLMKSKEIQEDLIKNSGLLKYGFDAEDIRKFSIIVSEKEVEKLLAYDIPILKIRELYNERFSNGH